MRKFNEEHAKWEGELKKWEEEYEHQVKIGGGADKIEYVDALISTMKKAIESGDDEDARLAAKMYTELAANEKTGHDAFSGYFADHFSYDTDSEEIVTGLQLCRNLGVLSYSDDGSNLLKSFTADRTINHPFWQELMKHEARSKTGIDKVLLKAVLSQDPNDIKEAMKRVL